MMDLHGKKHRYNLLKEVVKRKVNIDKTSAINPGQGQLHKHYVVVNLKTNKYNFVVK